MKITTRACVIRTDAPNKPYRIRLLNRYGHRTFTQLLNPRAAFATATQARLAARRIEHGLGI